MTEEGGSENFTSDKDDLKNSDSQLHVKAGGNCILVSPRQRGNPLLKSITNVPWQFDDRMIADYLMGQTNCALYLSMRYHNLNPDYIHGRLKILGKNYLLRVLLVMVDIIEPQQTLRTLTKLAILANLTVILCRSSEEAGKIIERYKIYQYKPPDIIMKKKKKRPYNKLKSALKTVRFINKTNAKTLISVFGTLENILKSPKIGFAVCQGISDQKAARLYKALHHPFMIDSSMLKEKKFAFCRVIHINNDWVFGTQDEHYMLLQYHHDFFRIMNPLRSLVESLQVPECVKCVLNY